MRNRLCRKLAQAASRTRFFVAGIQMPVRIGGGNIAAMAAEIEKTMAIHPGVDMIVFSELAAHGPLHAVADPTVDEEVFFQLARKHRVWILPAPGSSSATEKPTTTPW